MSNASTIRGYLVLAALAVVIVLFVSSLLKKDEAEVAAEVSPPEVAETAPAVEQDDTAKDPPTQPYVWEGTM